MPDFNRLIWMVLFLLGTVAFAWLEWRSNGGSKMVFFMLTSLWSAVCAISYTIMHWFITRRMHS